MFRNVTRQRLIQVWFAILAIATVAFLATGGQMVTTSSAIVAVLCLTPALMLRMLWPTTEAKTVAQVIYEAEQRR
jgi:hypothetical protein